MVDEADKTPVAEATTGPLGTQLTLNFSAIGATEATAAYRAAIAETAPADTLTLARLNAAIAAANLVADPKEFENALDSLRELEQADGPSQQVSSYRVAVEVLQNLGPDRLAERLQKCHETLQLAIEHRDEYLAPTALFLLLGSLTEAGEFIEVDRQLSGKSAIARTFPELPSGRHAKWFQCLRATIDGRTDNALALADEGAALATADNDPDTRLVWAGQRAVVRWMQDDLADVEEVLLQARQLHPDEPVWVAALARLWLRQGRSDAARGLLEALLDIADAPRDRNWLAAAAIGAEAVAQLGSATQIRRMQRLLKPYAERIVTIGLGVTCWGTVALVLARLALRLEQFDVAESYILMTISQSSELGAPFWLAEAHCLAAELALASKGDLEHAAHGLQQAAAAARSLKFEHVLQNATELSAQIASAMSPTPQPRSGLPDQSVSAAPAGGPHAATEPDPHAGNKASRKPQITILDGFGVTGLDGSAIHWRSRKARVLLQLLLSRRGAPLKRRIVYEELWPDTPESELGNRLAVAVATVRRALDPLREKPHDYYVFSQHGLLQLHTSRIRVDADELLTTISTALHLADSPQHRERATALLLGVVESGPPHVFFEEEEPRWAAQYRYAIETRFITAAQRLAEIATEAGDYLSVVDAYQRVLQLDHYDEAAHDGLVRALMRLGAHGRADAARRAAREALGELGIG